MWRFSRHDSTIMRIEKIKGTSHTVQENAFDALPCLPWYWHTGAPAQLVWQHAARMVADWLTHQGVATRDAVVVLPQPALVRLAKQAWANELGGWMPRFETVGSLMHRLPSAPANVATLGETLVLNETIDALVIARGLRQSCVGGWVRQWPDHAEVAVERVMALAHEWIKVCLSLSPDARVAHVAQAQQWRHLHGLSKGPAASDGMDDIGARERWLAGQALDWALQSWPALVHRTQALFEHRPAAWLAVTVGRVQVPGSDASLMGHVLQHAHQQGVPVCWLPACWQAAGGGSHADSALGLAGEPSLTQTRNFDHEARAAAAWVVQSVNQRRAMARAEPVAFITHDRALSRRVRALLMPHESQGQLVIADESGWTLSTTRAAAAVTRLLAAAHPTAQAWDVLDWLLHGWVDHGLGEQAVERLEQAWREHQVLMPWMLVEAPSEVAHVPSDAGALLWRWAQTVLAPLQALATGPQTLLHALDVFGQALQVCGAWSRLSADTAGVAVLKVLHLNPPVVPDALHRAWERVAAAHTVNLQGLSAWAQQNLARVNYEPPVSTLAVDVVFTPLGRAVLRPFSGVVLPGVDEGQLGVAAPAGHVLGMHEIGLGLPSPSVRAEAQWSVFALLAAQPNVMAVYRQNREGEPCGPSPWLGRWWWLAHAQTWPHHWPLAADPCLLQAIPVQALRQAGPRLLGENLQVVGPDLLAPVRLSATAYQRLRDCPYRYFAMDVLKLKAVDEVEDIMANHDYGTWLHAVLKRYHEQERETVARNGRSEDEDVQVWLAIADEMAECLGLLKGGKQAYFGLYRSTLADLARHYVCWHRTQAAHGWQWHGLEQSLEMDLPLTQVQLLQKIRLYGELDRVDTRRGAEGTQWRVIDYKTGSLNALKTQVRQPLEDTQMAFYALLTQATTAQDGAPIQALYLRLHHEAVDEVVHADVQDSAQVLAEGIASDLTRIHQGHAMLAMGEGRLCDRCEARGLCRKDHWTQAAVLAVDEKAIS
jgi:ATP-dependent helicase/nuclease subunit B